MVVWMDIAAAAADIAGGLWFSLDRITEPSLTNINFHCARRENQEMAILIRFIILV